MITSDRSVTINWASDITYQQSFASATSTTGSGQNELVTVTTALAVTVPSNAVGVTILPPTANTLSITIKGVTGDTGISLHLTDPTSIGLSTTSTTFVLASAGTTSTISGVRLIWS